MSYCELGVGGWVGGWVDREDRNYIHSDRGGEVGGWVGGWVVHLRQ